LLKYPNTLHLSQPILPLRVILTAKWRFEMLHPSHSTVYLTCFLDFAFSTESQNRTHPISSGLTVHVSVNRNCLFGISIGLCGISWYCPVFILCTDSDSARRVSLVSLIGPTCQAQLRIAHWMQ